MEIIWIKDVKGMYTNLSLVQSLQVHERENDGQYELTAYFPGDDGYSHLKIGTKEECEKEMNRIIAKTSGGEQEC
ncbi:hypothetical protein V0288_22380 [Pannus brasiliensis CCIBt3594]|uniref:Uncharacterized protein n=1 Tax=Pannus brasiliensis CCIBt3594 TaxID=1427578 RepID=A0AAW9QZJ8_9CHRO